MPIRILCPEGCRFVAPVRQAGKQIRCPKCKTVLRIPALDESADTGSERLVILTAERVGDSGPEIEPVGATAAPRSVNIDVQGSSDRFELPEVTAPLAPLAEPAIPERIADPAETAPPNESPRSIALTARDEAEQSAAPLVPAVDPPAAADVARRETDEPSRLVPSSTTRTESGTRSDDGASPDRELPIVEPLFERPTPVVALPTIRLDEVRLAVFEGRRHQQLYEMTRRSIARIIAFLILLLGLANVLIGAWQSGWLTNPSTAELRSWAIVLILVGALHAAYAALLAQVGDWSAHWVAAVFLLGVATVSAAFAVVLALAPAEHLVIRWLELPRLLQFKGAIWSLCMVLMASSLAWWCGREALRWRDTVRCSTIADEGTTLPPSP